MTTASEYLRLLSQLQTSVAKHRCKAVNASDDFAHILTT